jgi:FkbM family methyltransferase
MNAIVKAHAQRLMQFEIGSTQSYRAMDEALIYDVGAHTGEDTEFYLRMGYRVVAVEANPDLVSALRARFSVEIADGRLTIVDRAISREAGQIKFYANARSMWGTADPAWADRNARMGFESREVIVTSATFESVLQTHGCPVYLKIDIEGADMLCVEGLRGCISKPRFISIESSKTSWRELRKEFAALQSLGYTRFQIINQRKHRPQNLRTRNGEDIYFRFKEGDSGPFGPYLRSDRWISANRAMISYLPIFIMYKALGDNTLLSRLLSKVPLLWRLPNAVSWYDTHAMR